MSLVTMLGRVRGASGLVLLFGCGGAEPPIAISLVEHFGSAVVENAVVPAVSGERVQWRFDGDSTVEVEEPELQPTSGWRALHGVEGLAVRDGHLVGRTGEVPVLIAAAPAGLDPSDTLHAIEIRIAVSSGSLLGVDLDMAPEFDEEALVASAKEGPRALLSTDLIPGETFQTYTLTGADSRFDPSFPFSRLRHVLLRPSDDAGAEFKLESIRLVSRNEHLASIASGVSWQGLGDIYRETIVARSPERISFELDVAGDPYLEVALGTVEPGPVTFEIALAPSGEAPGEVLARRTVSTVQRWETLHLELGDFLGRRSRLVFSLDSPEPGAIGFWGGPTLRNRNGRAQTADRAAALDALAPRRHAPPRGVILIVVDTLRRDHFQPYGHARPNAPVLSRMAEEGALFLDAIAQGAWTKVSVPSILTSLYPTTHGLIDMPDRLSAAVTTLAEAYRSTGHATFASSSVPFTGKLSNLHQGIEVLHERASVTALDASSAKTARIFTDRLLAWIEAHRDVPFFATLHVFDPHSPFEPEPPYERLWMDADSLAEFRADMETVARFVERPFFKAQSLPTQAEMDASGVEQATYVARERTWYDASILAMDVEIGRLLERLDELGLAEDTLIALISDHGEEFLEHGRHFHGYSAYGDMLNVPLLLWWPGVIPAGVAVPDTVEAIDLMPTLLELSQLPGPAEMQGQSLLPLLARNRDATELGWEPRPAFAERARAPIAFPDDPTGRSSLVIVHDGWKLIQNVERPDGWPEYELFDHVGDPINLENVAEAHPDLVKSLAARLEEWHANALAVRIESDTSDMSAEEIQRLRSLGYLN